MRKYRLPIILALVLLLFGLNLYVVSTKQTVTPIQAAQLESLPTPSPTPAPIPSNAKTLPPRTKTSGCHAKGALQDKECSPGLADPTLTKDVICSSTFRTKTIRDVSESKKKAVYAEYGILTHTTGEYEIDHIISLELGGSNDIANLYPEAAEPRPGFHEKDKIENYLHKQVCNGAISLEEAQWQIATNWLQISPPQ
jgi:hypothetical protein